VEDHVTIYANATIVGGETVIGAGSTIGANVFLMQSVPANSLVLQEEVNVKVITKSRPRNQSLGFPNLEPRDFCEFLVTLFNALRVARMVVLRQNLRSKKKPPRCRRSSRGRIFESTEPLAVDR